MPCLHFAAAVSYLGEINLTGDFKVVVDGHCDGLKEACLNVNNRYDLAVIVVKGVVELCGAGLVPEPS